MHNLKQIIIAVGILLPILFYVSCNGKQISADYQRVIPLPQNIQPANNGAFELNSKTVITYTPGDESMKRTAQFLGEYLKLATGFDLTVTEGATTNNTITLQTKYASEHNEAYHLTVGSNQIIIDGKDNAGVFYGIQTLRKSILYSEDMKGNILFPSVDIVDYPRFGYRGGMLDVCRHFFDTAFVKKYIDLLALHNINRFHWHLTDDQGWRIEIKKYPKLTEIGSKRAQTLVGMSGDEYDGIPHEGFYTQEEIKDIVAYAAERFITIVPEIDIPGHSSALLASYPNLGCTGGPYKVQEVWMATGVVCAGNEDIYPFLEDVLTEIIELFPSTYIHIGGDEATKKYWEKCPKCQAKIHQLGLKADAEYSAEHKLQSYMTSRFEKFLSSKGRRLIGWDEILEGGLAPNATVMSWQGEAGGIKSAKMHHDVIMAPNTHIYLDYHQSTSPAEGMAFPGYNPIDRAYSFEPVSDQLTDDEKKYIIGVQANLWTEFVATPERAEYMVLPRLAAVSELQWVMPENKNYDRFINSLYDYVKLYSVLGYNHSGEPFSVKPKVDVDSTTSVRTLTLTTFNNAPIYYTLDGSEPTTTSTKYELPLTIDKTTMVKAAAYRDNKMSDVYVESFAISKATDKAVSVFTMPIPLIFSKEKGASVLTDGYNGNLIIFGGDWWCGLAGAFGVVIDMKEPTEFSTIKANMRKFMGVTQTLCKIEVSDDDKSYTVVYEKPLDLKDKLLDISLDKQTKRFIKITVAPEDKGAILCDEILIE